MKAWFHFGSGAGTRIWLVVASFATIIVASFAPNIARSQNVVWIKDGYNFPEHRLRGQTRAEADLEAGVSKFYVPICTFPSSDQREVRRYEIRKNLYSAANIIVMADLCNDVLPNASQQDAFVKGYNAVMDAAIAKRFGNGWKELIEKRVEVQLQKHPKGRLRANEINFETSY